MQKAWKVIGSIFFIVFALFLVLLIGGFIFLKNLDIARYKPQIIKIATQSLGRQVDFKDIDLKVSFNEGIRFYLSDFVIGENPDFGSKDFFSAGEIDAGLDILSLVFARQISVPNVLIRSPRINIIRNPNGILNIQTLGQPSQWAPPKSKGQPLNPAALSALFINSFKIENAELFFTEKSGQSEQNISITQLNLTIRNFSPAKPFEFSVDGAVLSTQTDLRFNGKIQLNLLKNEVRLIYGDASVDLGRLSFAELKALPSLKGIAIPAAIKGQLQAKIKEAVVSDKGLSTFVVDISLVAGQISAFDIAPGISLDARHLDFSFDNFSLDGAAPARLNLAAALYQDQTNVSFKSDVFFDFKAMGIRLANGKFATKLALWPLEKLKAVIIPLKEISLPEHLSGEFQAEIKDLSAGAEGLKNVLLDARLSAGELTLKEFFPGALMVFNKTDLTVKDFSLGKTFFVSLKTAYLSEEPDISFEGNVIYDFNTQGAVVKDAVLGLDLDRFSLQRFKASGLVSSSLPIPSELAGKLQARVNSLTVSAKSVDWMNMDIEWLNGKFSIPEAAPGISVTVDNINLELKDFSLKEAFDVTASLGYESRLQNIFFNGKVAFDPAVGDVHLSKASIKLDLSGIPFEHLKTTINPLKAVSFPEVIKGELDVIVKEFSAGQKGLTEVKADIFLKDGEVSMKEAAPGVSFAVSHINADIKDFVIGTPFNFNIALAYLHDKPNIKARGAATIRLEDQSVMIKDSTVETDLSTFAIEELKSSILALKGASLPEKIEGKFNIVIAEAVAGAKGLNSLTSQGFLKGGVVKLKELVLAIEGLDANFRLTDKDLTMDTIQASIGKGRIAAYLEVKDYLSVQKISLSAELQGIDLVEILDQKQAPVKIEGLVFGNFKAEAQGSDINSVSADGNLEVKESKLKDFNVLKTLLGKISFFPNVSSRIETSLSEKYKEKLNNKDTEIKKISALCVLSKGIFFVDPVSIEADEFIFSGKSQAGFDQKYSLDGDFKIPAELSRSMANGVSEMQYLFDENKNISLPVHITGQGSQKPVIALTQTAVEIGKNALLNEGKKELEKALKKALGAGFFK